MCVCVGSVESAEPPVSSAVSNNGFALFKLISILPAPNAAQVPNPNKVPGLVLMMAV